MLTIIFSILIFLSVVVILVTIHEFGHFIVAKLFGMKVLRFSVGFGKPLWSIYDKQGTEYVIAPIPLGGYVKLLDEREAPVAENEKHLEFNHRPIYQRFCVLFAGVFFNFLFAVFAFWIVFSVGITFVKPIVGTVGVNTPAAQAGLKTGDEIIAINGNRTPHWPAVAMNLIVNYGENAKLKVTVQNTLEKNNLLHDVIIAFPKQELNALRPNPLQQLGITPYFSTTLDKNGQKILSPTMLGKIHYPFYQAWLPAFQTTINFIKFNFIIIYKMLTGAISIKGIAGPLGIMEVASTAAAQGWLVYLNFLALMSISIAIVNLLPIPGLDGGQILYVFIEFLRGKPLSIPVQVLLFRLGVIALLLLIITSITNDLLRLM